MHVTMLGGRSELFYSVSATLHIDRFNGHFLVLFLGATYFQIRSILFVDSNCHRPSPSERDAIPNVDRLCTFPAPLHLHIV